jgi:uncharacterized protein
LKVRSDVKNKVAGKENSMTTKVDKKSDFSFTFNSAQKNYAESHIQEMIAEIEILGKRLVSTRSLNDVKRYKDKIREYLKYIVKNAYTLIRENKHYDPGIYTRIEIINKELDDLARNVIEENKEVLDLADRIDAIRGLLVDVYK